MNKSLYKQETYTIEPNGIVNMQNVGSGYEHIVILRASHKDYELSVNGYKIGKVEPRISLNIGTDIAGFKINNTGDKVLEIMVSVSAKGVVDSRSELGASVVDTKDQTAHGKLDVIATANQSTVTAVQGLNTKFDGVYMAGVIPHGKNHFISSNTRLWKGFSSGVHGCIIRLLVIAKSNGYSTVLRIGGQAFGQVGNGPRSLENFKLQNRYIPPNTMVECYHNSSGLMSVNYDILDANGDIV